MKKLLLTTALVCMAAPASAEVPYYLSVAAGITHTSDADWNDGTDSGDFDIDRTANFAGAVGAVFWPNIRTELEVSYRNADLNEITVDGVGSAELDGEVKTWAFLLNGYYDFTLPNTRFKPYLSAGIGAARHKADVDAVAGLGTPGADASDTVFAYQAGAGASYELGNNVALFGGYRYLGTSDADFDGIETDYDANEVRLGLRFSF